MTTATLIFPLAWKSEYDIGHPTIDAQHHRLLELANLLHQAIASGHGEDVRAKAFDALLLYTHQHFEDEEQVFADFGCQQLTEHQKHHEMLADELRQLANEDMLGFSANMNEQLEDWVMTHLLPHMTVEDQEAWQSCTQAA